MMNTDCQAGNSWYRSMMESFLELDVVVEQVMLDNLLEVHSRFEDSLQLDLVSGSQHADLVCCRRSGDCRPEWVQFELRSKRGWFHCRELQLSEQDRDLDWSPERQSRFEMETSRSLDRDHWGTRAPP